MQHIAHVFPSKSKRVRHLNEVFCNDLGTDVSKSLSQYMDNDGNRNHCFVVTARDDIDIFLAYEFHRSEVHGPGEYALSTEDYDHMCVMLKQRTRHIPEVA